MAFYVKMFNETCFKDFCLKKFSLNVCEEKTDFEMKSEQLSSIFQLDISKLSLYLKHVLFPTIEENTNLEHYVPRIEKLIHRFRFPLKSKRIISKYFKAFCSFKMYFSSSENIADVNTI